MSLRVRCLRMILGMRRFEGLSRGGELGGLGLAKNVEKSGDCDGVHNSRSHSLHENILVSVPATRVHQSSEQDSELCIEIWVAASG